MIRNRIKIKKYVKLRHERHGNCSKTNKKILEQPQTDGETTESIQNNWKRNNQRNFNRTANIIYKHNKETQYPVQQSKYS